MDRYELTFDVPPEMLHRAMTSWAKVQRSRRSKAFYLVICICVGVVIGVLGNVTGIFDMISGGAVLGALGGFYLGIMVWYFVARRQMQKIAGLAQIQLAKNGPVLGVYAPSGVEISSKLSTTRSTWAVYDEVILLNDATALRSGGVIYPIPHAALPQGVDPAAFHADLIRWQEAGQ